MAKRYIIGIDSGSQSTKLMMYDTEGNVVCESKNDLRPMHQPKPGIVEHPDDDLWDSLCAAGKKLMAAFTGDQKDIIGIGLGAIRCCRVLLKADGTLAAPIMSWQDERVSRPYEHTNPDVAYVTSTSGYLTHRLTGNFHDNVGNYFGQWPVDFKTWDWSFDEAIITKFNLPHRMLFKLYKPGEIVGRISGPAAAATGFPAGLPLVCTTSDKAVEGLGAGLIDEHSAVVSLGTYITLMINRGEMPKNPKHHWGIISSMPNLYIYECYGIRRGMWTVSWLRELLGESLIKNAHKAGRSPEDYLNMQAQKVPAGCDGLMTILDWLTNPWEPFKRGMMIGFEAHMNYAYMYRSIIESIALIMKNNYDRMCGEIDVDIKRLIISGGGSNSDLIMQIFADVFGMPAHRNKINNAASIGAAINAAVATGVYDSYEAAVGRMVKTKDIFRPIPENVDMYVRYNQGVFRDLTKHTDKILKKSYAVFHARGQGVAAAASWSQT